VINEALQSGLKLVEKSAERKPYSTVAHDMGLRCVYNLANTQDLLTHKEIAVITTMMKRWHSSRRNKKCYLQLM
jgi:hypothetical protein